MVKQRQSLHTSGNWWDRWIVYYMSAFILWLAKLMGNSYGWAIIVFTVIVRVILVPLNAISIRSTTKMQSIQPQINELRKKYPGRDTESRTLLQQETNKLYKEAGVKSLYWMFACPDPVASYVCTVWCDFTYTAVTNWALLMDGFKQARSILHHAYFSNDLYVLIDVY